MSIQIYNTQTQKLEAFQPFHPGEVRMYVCGPTVYDFLHVGNYRGAIFFNLVRNWFEKSGYKVTYVYNYTDVDDKIIHRANELGVNSSEVSERFIKEFEIDYKTLGLKSHSYNPRVTEHMDGIIDFIQNLVAQNKAYVVDGDVYYDILSFKDYGKLSHKKLEDLESGHRIEVDGRKKHPADFALWKGTKEGEPSWSSPWGQGRPGWHIECSAMIRALLGETIDIHGGGMDLIFPHHENEVAQSEGCTGKPFVRYWMHNNMINFGQQKMSKSLGNIVTGRSFIEQHGPEVLKFMVLSVHYRSPLDLSEEQIHIVIRGLARIYSSLALAEKLVAQSAELVPVPEKFQKTLDEAERGIEQSLNDDFNTAEVMARIYEVVRTFNNLCRTPGKLTPEKKAVAEVFYSWLRDKGRMLALFQEPAQDFLRNLDDRLLKEKGLVREEVDQLVRERSQARLDKNFQRSDELRDQLKSLGILVQDSAEGTEWEVDK